MATIEKDILINNKKNGNTEILYPITKGNNVLCEDGETTEEKLLKAKEVVISSTEPTTTEKVWFKKGKNLFRAKSLGGSIYSVEMSSSDNNILLNGTATGDGGIGTNIFDLQDGMEYTISANISKNHYIIQRVLNGVIVDNMAYLNSTNTSYTFTYKKNETYNQIRLYVMVVNGTAYEDYQCNIQIEEGSTATEFEEYIEPKIFIKNDNEMYESFSNLEEQLNRKLLVGFEDISQAKNYDLNNLKAGTTYSWSLGDTPTNVPFNTAGRVYCIYGYGKQLAQIGFCYNNNSFAIRTCFNNNWTSWKIL